MLDPLVLFCISFAGTLFSSLTAGGSTMVTLPLLLAYGIPAPSAIAIQKFNGIFFSFIAGHNYARGQRRDWRFIIIFALIGMAAAYVGLTLLLSLNERLVRRVFGGIILCVILLYYFRPDLGHETQSTGRSPVSGLDYLAAIPFGLYEGFLGSGNALIFSLFATKRLGMDMLTTLAHYYTIATSWVTVILVVLFFEGHFDWTRMIPALLGAVSGATLGTRFVAARGNKFIRRMLLATGSILAIRLLFFGG